MTESVETVTVVRNISFNFKDAGEALL